MGESPLLELTERLAERKALLSKKYKEQLELAKSEGTEEGHMKADNLLCELLDELGYNDVTKVFKEVRKWYA